MTVLIPTLGVMIDIETLGTKHDAIVTQVAMVPWLLGDPEAHAGHPLHSFLGIAPQMEQLIPPRRMDAGTILYWMGQPDAARAAFKQNDSTDFVELEAYMRHFVARFNAVTEGHEYEIWTRGNFDIPILESLLRQLGMPIPWAKNFRALRDLRTLMVTAGVEVSDVPEPTGFVKHDALWDCKFQIACYNESMRQLRARV